MGDPYILLTDFLNLDEIIEIADKFNGKFIEFRKNIVEDEYYFKFKDIVGREKAIRILNILSGQPVYFPTIKRACIDVVYELIRKEFNGYNYSELAQKYKYCERQIRNIVKEVKKSTSQIDESQLTIWEVIESFNTN